MKIYTCWITCMLESYQDRIVAGLVKKGYVVGSASNSEITVNRDNQVSALLALSIYKIDQQDLPITHVYEDLAFILTDIKAYFYSVVIAETVNSTWAGSNIILPPKKQTQLLPAATDSTKKSKLN